MDRSHDFITAIGHSTDFINTKTVPLTNRFLMLNHVTDTSELNKLASRYNHQDSNYNKNHNRNKNKNKNKHVISRITNPILKPLDCKGFKIAHLNIRSLLPKIEEIRLLTREADLDICAFTETWISAGVTDNLIHINGYRVYRNDRETEGGGVAIYIKETIQHILTKDLISKDIENIWVTVKPEHNKQFLVSCMYRPPSSNHQYLENIIDCIENANKVTTDIIMLGDLNLKFNVADVELKNLCVYLQSILGARQLITSPTRVTATSSTIIDHIYTTIPEKHVKSGVIELSISDHYLIYTVLNSKYVTRSPKEIKIRSYSNFNKISFLQDIAECNYLNIQNNMNINTAWTQWKSAFFNICNKHAPIKNIRVKDRNNPWVTQDILQLMYRRDKAHSKAKKSSDTTTWGEYRYLRNLVVSELRRSEQAYFTSEIDKHKGKSSMWKPLKMALNTNHKTNSLPPNLTANKLNKYYISVGTKLANKFNSECDLSHLEETDTTFSFQEISVDKVLRKLVKLKSTSKLDILDFDCKLLQCCANLIAPQLAKLYNLSIEQGKIPGCWKKAKVTPIYKGKGDNDNSSNYRPISTLPFIAKILESCVQEQLISHLNRNNILCCEQFAYLKNHSTNSSLHRVVDEWLTNIIIY